jgi:hypothetical protein
MLLSEIETQKQSQGTARPPILAIPGSDDHATQSAAVATKEAK